MISPHLLLAFAIVGLSACAADRSTAIDVQGPPRDASPVQTDSLVYHLRRTPGEYSAYVTAVYRNATGGPVFFARCNAAATTPMFYPYRTGADSTRTFFTDWAWACVGGVPTGTIAPGDSVVVRVRFGSVDQPNMQPPLQPGDLVGDFRVALFLCTRPETDSDKCSAPPQAQSSSNAFSVVY